MLFVLFLFLRLFVSLFLMLDYVWFSELKTARKKSRPARKSSHRVSLCDGIRWKPTKCDTYTYEETTLLKKKEPQKENHRYRSTSLPSDTNSIGVINEGLDASVLDRCKEPAPVSGSTKRVSLPFKTEANSKSVLNSCITDFVFQQNKSRS